MLTSGATGVWVIGQMASPCGCVACRCGYVIPPRGLVAWGARCFVQVNRLLSCTHYLRLVGVWHSIPTDAATQRQRYAQRGWWNTNLPDKLFDQETIVFDQETYVFSQETYVFDQETYVFDQETYVFGQETYVFSQETYVFGQETYVFGQETYVFGQETVVLDSESINGDFKNMLFPARAHACLACMKAFQHP